MIKEDVKLGKGTVIVHPELVNLYGCEIGENCKIGAFVEIRREVSIGNNVKIQPNTISSDRKTAYFYT